MSPATDRWVLARHRLREDTWGVLIVWPIFAAFVFALVFAVALFRPIEISGWETGSQIPRWFAGGIGVHLTAVNLPLYVAHGYTRREVARQGSLATVAVVALLTGLMTLGYALERLVYSAAGWPQALTQSHLFSAPDAYGLILLEFALLFTVWTTAGALAGAGFYRSPGLGFAVLPLALLMIGLAEAVLNPGFFELVTAASGFLGLDLGDVSIGAAAGLALASVAAASPLTWLLVRDMPLRSQHA